MPRFFNTAGPCVPGDHYMIDQAERFENIHQLIDDKSYFVLHAPRQTEKTTAILQLTDELNAAGKYIALYTNVEASQAWRNNINELNRVIIDEIRTKAEVYLDPALQPSPVCSDFLLC